ncbi:hypothetical protein ACTJJ0_05905 [Chitinophaga sp. 22321]|uniref:Uncharacterized protein n=1 Tax=Chitinophaga hostae TaxID=2831022 RepID=A0ABS5IZ06_9BACT|nr:hypothetical protein [Chitinophaga hostae]MBS0028208.1 hypothetical protein [Chitinophaga hostae]
MKYKLIFAAVTAMAVTVIVVTGAIAQYPSKGQRKQVADTCKKTSTRTAAPAFKPIPKVDTTKRADRKHLS